MRKTLLSAILIGALSGCTSVPSEQELANADYGRETSQAECEALVKAQAEIFLKDADSAKYQFGHCEKRGMQSIPVIQIPKQYGYFIPVQINSKNGFGGYTGYKSYQFLIKNGAIIRKARQDDKYELMFPF